MRISDSIQRLGPWNMSRVFSDVLTEVQMDAALSDWRARPIANGGGVVLQIEEILANGKQIVGRKLYPVNSDTTIGALITAALASGAPILAATVPTNHRVIIGMYTVVATPPVYVCPANGEHQVYPNVGLFCPVDGLALVTE